MLKFLNDVDIWITSKIVLKDAVLNPAIRLMFLLVEWIAHGIPWLIISGLGTIHSIHRDRSEINKWKWTVLLFGILIDLAAIGVTKMIFRRNRPPYNADDQIYEAPIADKYSFPSGHSSRAAMLMILGMKFFNMKYQFVWVVFPTFLGFTRIAMGRHYFFDVVAGNFYT